MKFIEESLIVSNENICENIYKMVLQTNDIAKHAKAGQFVELYTGEKDILLPRPISISSIDDDKLTLVYSVVGKGTAKFSDLKAGAQLRTMGPLGNGFSVDKTGTHALVGGGIGVPPLLELAKQLKGELFVFIGARTTPILVDEFKRYTDNVFVATDDGSYGFKGNVVDLMREKGVKPDNIYSCGPKVMLRAVSDFAKQNNIVAEISMEERMACGIGACVGCVTKVMKDGEPTNLKICKDGPVFLSTEVIFND